MTNFDVQHHTIARYIIGQMHEHQTIYKMIIRDVHGGACDQM